MDSGRPRCQQRLGSALMIGCAISFGIAGCGQPEPELTGIWKPDDGSGPKIINEDATCSGMYYDGGQVLDIGGVATCNLGDKSDGGDYVFVVRQPPNEQSYLVRFESDDTAVLMSSSGDPIVTLKRM